MLTMWHVCYQEPTVRYVHAIIYPIHSPKHEEANNLLTSTGGDVVKNYSWILIDVLLQVNILLWQEKK